MLEIGKKIKTIRTQKGWSQAEICEMIGISVPAFSKIETDHTDINISRLKQIAEVLRVPLSDLVSSDGNVTPNNDEELKKARETIELQANKISHLQEYVITLYEQLHKAKERAVSSDTV